MKGNKCAGNDPAGALGTFDQLFPCRADLPYDDPLRISRGVANDLLKRVKRTQDGCLTVGRDDKVRLADGRRLRASRYIHLRCISASVPPRLDAACRRGQPGTQICIAPRHLIAHATKRDVYTVAPPHVEPEGRFSDLPRIVSNPARTFTFSAESVPAKPIILFEVKTKTKTRQPSLAVRRPPPPLPKGCTTISSQRTTPSTRAVVP
jgi:hypothetical protein